LLDDAMPVAAADGRFRLLGPDSLERCAGQLLSQGAERTAAIGAKDNRPVTVASNASRTAPDRRGRRAGDLYRRGAGTARRSSPREFSCRWQRAAVFGIPHPRA